VAVVDAHPATGGDPAPRLDAGDAAAAEPDELHRVRAVEELGLQGRDGLTRRVDDAAEPAGDLDAAAGLQLAQRDAPPLLDLLLQLVGVEPGGAGGKPVQK